MTNSQQTEIADLRALSARLGRDPLLVQASSGNTSIKLADNLWIKASGKWLARATEADAFVPVPLAGLRAALHRNEHENIVGAMIRGASIETPMHAVLPHRVVVHVHSVNTLSWAVRRDGERCIAERLDGLNWCWIPCVASGLPLAHAIETAVTTNPGTSVFVLANHGLVVGGESCAAAEDLLSVVEARLAARPRNEPQHKDTDPDPVTTRILQGGILYPCQAMFLGTDPPLLNDAAWGAMTHTQRAVLAGLMQVVRRIDESASIRYLSGAEVSDLLSQDAHGYLECARDDAPKAEAPSATPAVARAGS